MECGPISFSPADSHANCFDSLQFLTRSSLCRSLLPRSIISGNSRNLHLLSTSNTHKNESLFCRAGTNNLAAAQTCANQGQTCYESSFGIRPDGAAPPCCEGLKCQTPGYLCVAAGSAIRGEACTAANTCGPGLYCWDGAGSSAGAGSCCDDWLPLDTAEFASMDPTEQMEWMTNKICKPGWAATENLAGAIVALDVNNDGLVTCNELTGFNFGMLQSTGGNCAYSGATSQSAGEDEPPPEGFTSGSVLATAANSPLYALVITTLVAAALCTIYV